VSILKLYGDRESVKMLEDQRRTMGDVLDGLGMTMDGRDKSSEYDFCLILQTLTIS
jgi:hypothetical protein